MQIRRAQNGDIPDVLRLLVQVDMVHHNIRPDLFKGPSTKYDEAQLRALFADERTPVFVMEGDGGQVVGYAMCQVQRHVGDRVLTDIRTLYIDDICVDEAWRGKGVGGQLFACAAEYARSIGCYNVTLNVWEGNGDAKRFYEGRGMKPQKYGMEMIL